MMAFLAGVGLVGQADPPPERPYSCRLYDDEQRKCVFDAVTTGRSNGSGASACATEDGHEHTETQAATIIGARRLDPRPPIPRAETPLAGSFSPDHCGSTVPSDLTALIGFLASS
jgi:hypothetical protein